MGAARRLFRSWRGLRQRGPYGNQGDQAGNQYRDEGSAQHRQDEGHHELQGGKVFLDCNEVLPNRAGLGLLGQRRVLDLSSDGLCERLDLLGVRRALKLGSSDRFRIKVNKGDGGEGAKKAECEDAAPGKPV